LKVVEHYLKDPNIAQCLLEIDSDMRWGIMCEKILKESAVYCQNDAIGREIVLFVENDRQIVVFAWSVALDVFAVCLSLDWNDSWCQLHFG
jgi:hypothetical protein